MQIRDAGDAAIMADLRALRCLELTRSLTDVARDKNRPEASPVVDTTDANMLCDRVIAIEKSGNEVKVLGIRL
jgi:hypothetical protein